VASHLKSQDASPRQQLTGLLDRLDDEAVFDMGLRSSMRRAIHAPVTLGVIAGGYKPLYRGWATDLSLNGLGLLTEHDVPMDAVLTINLESVAGEELLLPIRICYVMKMMSKTYRIGGIFSFMSEDPRDNPGQARLFVE
jgi:hypothetical protein